MHRHPKKKKHSHTNIQFHEATVNTVYISEGPLQLSIFKKIINQREGGHLIWWVSNFSFPSLIWESLSTPIALCLFELK